jgi:mono/diheme cytochrome c family protein
MTLSQRRAFRQSSFIRLVLIGIWIAVRLATSIALAADGDEDEDAVQPGLPAHYQAEFNGRKVHFDRHDALPAFRLANGESPDPRLPPEGWRVSWKGVLAVKSPGKYQFAGRASGTVVVRIDGQEALSLRTIEERIAAAEGQPVELKFGPRPLEIEFTPHGPAPELRIFWQSEDFPREPLPPWAVGHLPANNDDFDLFSTGRLLVEELSCVACHRPNPQAPLSNALGTRQGPRLTEAGARLKREWIYHWLGNPQEFRREAVMPRLFSSDRRGEVERMAVAGLLTARGKLPQSRKLDDNQAKNWPADGKALFETIGCAVCHEAQTDRTLERRARATLRFLGQKTTPEVVAAFLQNPAAVDPAGRMPAFAFTSGDDPFRLALYVTERDAAGEQPLIEPAPPEAAEVHDALAALGVPAADIAAFSQKPIDEQLRGLGGHVMRARRCTACHEMKIPGEDEFWKPVAAVHDFAAIAAKPEGGCLDQRRRTSDNGVPLFGASLDLIVVAGLLSEPQPPAAGLQSGARTAVAPAAASGDPRRTEASAIAAFLKEAAFAPGTLAPGEFAKLTLARFNCIGCHERNGAGGLPSSYVEKMLVIRSEKDSEAISPPPLTGITGKLLAPALRQVFDGNLRSRPWMALQMPRFDAARLAFLPAALAAADGESPSNEPFRPAADEELISAGRTLVGEKGFSCIKCHDMLGIASAGARGPELARVAERVTYDWYVRWMTDPQRLQPGTRMPTVFFGGKSTYAHILDGIPDRQRLALWQYLLVCRNLPYPEGLRPPQKLRFPESKGVQVVRTFLPDTSARGIALRGSDGLHLAYDAQSCRLSYAWSGEFLDMRPVWEGRGGNKAGIDGAIFWTAPAGFPWEITPSASPIPDYSNRGGDTSLGAILPQDGKLYPTRLDFRAVHPKPDCTTFDYDLDLGEGKRAAFQETVSTLRLPLAIGVRRVTESAVPLGHFVWLHVSSADQPPTWVTAGGASGVLDADTKTVPAGAVIKVAQAGKRFVLHQRAKTSHADWLAAKRGDRWSVVLRVPSPGDSTRTFLDVAVLKPFDDDPQTQDKVAGEELGK